MEEQIFSVQSCPTTTFQGDTTKLTKRSERYPDNREAVQGGVSAYIGKTVRRLETRMKEHWDACQKGALEKSALAEHAWESHHLIKWEEATVVDQARSPKELLLKEAIHIRLLTPPPSTGMGDWSFLDVGWLP